MSEEDIQLTLKRRLANGEISIEDYEKLVATVSSRPISSQEASSPIEQASSAGALLQKIPISFRDVGLIIYPLIGLVIVMLVPHTSMDEVIWTDDPLGYYQTFSPRLFGSRKYELTVESLDGTKFTIQAFRGSFEDASNITKIDGKELRNVFQGQLAALVSSGESLTFLVSPSNRKGDEKYGFHIKAMSYFRL
jgi:hypothetical protein